MRLAAVALFAVCGLAACKKKEQPSDGSSLAQIFAEAPDAAAADPSASVATDDPLPSLKPVTAPTPVYGAPKPSVAASAAASAAGNPNLPVCITARAYCGKNHSECEAKKQACLAAGGRM